MGLGLGLLRRSTSSDFLVGRRAGGPLPSTGPGPAATHRGWLGQVLAEAGWHRRLGPGSKAGVMPALGTIPTGHRALPGDKREVEADLARGRRGQW